MGDQGGEEHQLRCSSCLQRAQPRASLSFRSVSASKLAKVSENAQSARNLSRSCATRVWSWPQLPRPHAPSAPRAGMPAPPPLYRDPAPGPGVLRFEVEGTPGVVDLANTPLLLADTTCLPCCLNLKREERSRVFKKIAHSGPRPRKPRAPGLGSSPLRASPSPRLQVPKGPDAGRLSAAA
ncbi:uncharacterized protein LOC122683756 isoform X2 [Cervus elaphus]|uniref:uncharacterized protein LOC122683756 isoform X2 n=1 Tax=Cervus elaphus TaxID=9860 RepID=UPI001CC2D308|nr:uncharacterized protein LOC122683756 isoform X2 [Cervus elaphus]